MKSIQDLREEFEHLTRSILIDSTPKSSNTNIMRIVNKLRLDKISIKLEIPSHSTATVSLTDLQNNQTTHSSNSIERAFLSAANQLYQKYV